MKNLFSNRFPVAIISLLLILPLLASSCNKAENTDVSTYDNDSKIQDSISADANPGSEITVYITETGNKYHRAYCQYLRESKIEITLDLAIAFGYSRCSICNPPRMNGGSTSKLVDQEINWSDLWGHDENSFVESYTEVSEPTTSQFYSGEGTFGFGSTQESVKKIMGPPTSIRDYSFFTVWSYGISTVTFENGAVTEWNNYSHLHYTTCPSPMQPLTFLSPPHPSIRAVCFSTYSDSGRSSHVLSYKATASFACKLPHITVIKWSNSTHLK